jgi:hydrogenase/urease accessory protein HupE
VLPAHCTSVGLPRREAGAGSITSRWAIDCGDEGLVGAQLGVADLEEARISALLRLELADGRTFRRVLRADAPVTTVPERESAGEVLRSYGALGVEHILTGLDHLLFVLGLLLLVGIGRRLLATVTAFTVGHSATLSLAALGIVNLPIGAIELGIAFSIFVLALELGRGSECPPSLLRRRPWGMAFVFGLLHGLGFAGALAGVGLPQADIPLALFSFNVGIELGQLAFILAMLGLASMLRRPLRALPAWAEQVPVYTLGAFAAFWCYERAAALLS